MKIKLLSNIFDIPLFILSIIFILNVPLVAQEDNPLVDNILPEWLENINHQVSEEDVLTDGDGYDNFNLGVDFAEPHLTQNPNNPKQYFGAYNTNGAWFTNDGHDWTSIQPNFGTSVNGDPSTAYDNLGNLYYESMYGGVTGCKVIRSSNNGTTWGTSVTSISGNDKNWMAADQTTGPFANYIYTTMTPGNFARSTNNGASWTITETFGTQSLPGMMVCVGPNGSTDGGAVYVVTNSGNAFASTYTFYVSTDGGLNFTLKSAQNFANYVGTNVNGRNSVQNMRTRPYPFISADQSTGTYRGRFYCIYASNTPSGNGNKPDIFCRYSTNQGSTWSSAIKINDDLNTTVHNQWHPSIWCDKSTGRLYVKWMDTRDTPSSDSAYIYASYSDNGGVSWATNQRISNQKMKINCTTCGGGGTPRYQGDYDAIVSTNNQALMMWTDFRDGSFGSYVGYFPDFAMEVSPSLTTIENNNDSEFITI
ncbi:MAG: glycoside hydrolase, partial [Ignavibacteria bacterium]|nr:glycoside hydrolase [Ignavibacteria bacterium]